MQVMNSLMMIANVFLLLTRSLASARRISEVLDEQIVLSTPKNAMTEVHDGSVDFENVSFKYREDAQEYALSGVTLHFKPGQTIGILGGTGSSKTTLVQLIPRLYDATEGVVKVGGRDVREYDLKVLRDSVGMILQKNVLFPVLCEKICNGEIRRPMTTPYGRLAGQLARMNFYSGYPKGWMQIWAREPIISPVDRNSGYVLPVHC